MVGIGAPIWDTTAPYITNSGKTKDKDSTKGPRGHEKHTSSVPWSLFMIFARLVENFSPIAPSKAGELDARAERKVISSGLSDIIQTETSQWPDNMYFPACSSTLNTSRKGKPKEREFAGEFLTQGSLLPKQP